MFIKKCVNTYYCSLHLIKKIFVLRLPAPRTELAIKQGAGLLRTKGLVQSSIISPQIWSELLELKSNIISIIKLQSNNIINYIKQPKNILKLLGSILALRILVSLIISFPSKVNIYLALIALGILLDYYHTNKCLAPRRAIKKSLNYIFNNKIEFLIKKILFSIFVFFFMLFFFTILICVDTYFNTSIFLLLSKSPVMMLFDTSLVSGYLVFMDGIGTSSGGNNPQPPLQARGGPQPPLQATGGPQPPQGGGPQPPHNPHVRIPVVNERERDRRLATSNSYQSELPSTSVKLRTSYINRPDGVRMYSMNDPRYAETFSPLDHNVVCRHFAHNPLYKSYIMVNQNGDLVYTGKINTHMLHALSQPKV